MTASRGFSEAIATLNTLQRGQDAMCSANRPKISSRERIAAWIEYLELDISKLRYIHIAGTKGKGTTCLYTEHVLETYHCKYGLSAKIACLVKPHVTSVVERIRIDGRPVSEACFAEAFWPLWSKMQSKDATSLPGYPGFIVLLAFYIFTREGVDIAILETGMGGAFDSTNVVSNPVATGITELGFDHVKALGDTIESIAWHKAGIFKRGSPAFSVPQMEEAAEVLRQRAEERGTAVRFIGEELLLKNEIQVVPNELFQRRNAALAIALAEACVQHMYPTSHISPGIASCVQQTELPAKFEIISRGKMTWVLTSAHNSMSILEASKAFLSFVQERECSRALLFSHNSNRNSEGFLGLIFRVICDQGQRPFEMAVFCSEILDHGSEKNQDLCDLRRSEYSHYESRRHHQMIWERLSCRGISHEVSTVKRAVDWLQYVARTETVVLVIGSAYLAGMVRVVIQSNEPGYLSADCNM